MPRQLENPLFSREFAGLIATTAAAVPATAPAVRTAAVSRGARTIRCRVTAEPWGDAPAIAAGATGI